MSITVIQGSILDFKGDAIVNAANGHLRHGAGLAKVIADACAPKGSPERAPWWKEQFDHPLIPTGGAGVTSAGALPYKAVIHAVGPIWGGGEFYERDLLKRCYNSALRCAWQNNWNSIAFPAISCGIFGYPVNDAAEAVVPYVVDGADVFDLDVEFYIPEDHIYAAFKAALDA